MHPSISAFPSAHFYGGRLRDAAAVCSRPARDFHAHPSGRFGPWVLHQLSGGTASRGSSLLNPAEAAYALQLYCALLRAYPAAASLEVGVVTPYAAMRDELRRVFAEGLGAAGSRRVAIATVDAFQGQEKDVVIFCCVRATPRGGGSRAGVGFVGDRNRINVALTRARASLWIVGDFEFLARSPDWSALWDHARTHNCIYTPKTPLTPATSKLPVARAVVTLN